MRVADYIVQRVFEDCASHIFTVTGRGIIYLTDAAAKHGQVKCVPVHHEQAAAYAAVSYAAYTGKPGICLVSTGCASTNAITGVLCAWQDGIPCVFISGQNMLNETVNHTGLPIRTFGSQEMDIVPVVKPITKYAVMLKDPKRIVYELDKALYLAQNGVKGPVWLDIPLDIQNMRIEPDELERYVPDSDTTCVPLAKDISYVQRALQSSNRPVVLVGSGIRSAGAEAQLAEFVEKFKIPLVYAHSAPDVYGLEKDLSVGAVGSMYGTRAGNFAMQNSDLLLVIGCRLSSMTVGSEREEFARAAKKIVVDINPDEHTKNTVDIDRLITADASLFLHELNETQIMPSYNAWQDKCKHWKDLFPKCEESQRTSERVDLYYLAECLSETLPQNSVFLCDAGLEELILPSNIRFKSGMRCIHPAMQGAMGFAVPGSIGASMASGAPVCAVVGDGSIMMNLQELETIRYNNLPVKIIVVSNNMYSVIRKRQVELFRSRTIGTDPSNGVSCPDFSKVADCFGIPYFHISSSDGLKNGLELILNMEGAVICEVSAVFEQEYLRDAYAINSNRRLVHRPLEDLFPFIDRELFRSEMVIEPLD